ncbi:hypothetical protein MKW94_003436 [Papaver nudicaule]|uniref:Uncharacterized protein n=1 Tax=Papaver nudicaule TaxID=74823 RepID=A0AA41RMN0_PAPNU|nr:hypothetical protein [Papaver nudicaule]
MESGKVASIAFLFMFIVFCADFGNIIATNAQCCRFHDIGDCVQATDAPRCNRYCLDLGCSQGGQCAIRMQPEKCLCRCDGVPPTRDHHESATRV